MANNYTYGISEISVANPPAGSDQIYTIPAGFWEVLSIYFKITCNSTVQTRQPGLVIRSQPSTTPIVSQFTAAVLTASQLGLHSFGPGLAVASATSSGLVKTLGSLPSPLILKAGDTIETSTDNMVGADQITLFMIRLAQIKFAPYL